MLVSEKFRIVLLPTVPAAPAANSTPRTAHSICAWSIVEVVDPLRINTPGHWPRAAGTSERSGTVTSHGQRFRRRALRRGYKVDEVDSFLDRVEATITGAPIDAHGWLRASHRALDPGKSLPHRPYHTHDREDPLLPGQIYLVDIEIWPTCIVIPAGYRLGLSVRGNDYRYEGELSDFARKFHYAGRGVGPFKHADPIDRPADVFSGRVTIHVGGETDSFLLVPIIP